MESSHPHTVPVPLVRVTLLVSIYQWKQNLAHHWYCTHRPTYVCTYPLEVTGGMGDSLQQLLPPPTVLLTIATRTVTCTEWKWSQ